MKSVTKNLNIATMCLLISVLFVGLFGCNNSNEEAKQIRKSIDSLKNLICATNYLSHTVLDSIREEKIIPKRRYFHIGYWWKTDDRCGNGSLRMDCNTLPTDKELQEETKKLNKKDGFKQVIIISIYEFNSDKEYNSYYE